MKTVSATEFRDDLFNYLDGVDKAPLRVITEKGVYFVIAEEDYYDEIAALEKDIMQGIRESKSGNYTEE